MRRRKHDELDITHEDTFDKTSPRQGLPKLSARLKQQIKAELLPEDKVRNFDMDRILEEEENFLETDRKKPIALDQKKMVPKITSVNPHMIHDTSSKKTGKSMNRKNSQEAPVQKFDKYELELRTIIGDPLTFNKGYVLRQQHKAD